MSTKEKYRVTSPIKRNGKTYDVGDPIELTEEAAEGLHVKPWSDSPEGESGGADGPKPSPSMGLNAKPAIKVIETSDPEDIAGFVIPAPEGTEDRSSVLKAWKAKQAPEKEEKESK